MGPGDLVAPAVAGVGSGCTLLWAAVLGCAVRLVLTRRQPGAAQVLLDTWVRPGRRRTYVVAGYALVWGLVQGAAATTACALPLRALFPGVFPAGRALVAWAVLCGVAGLAAARCTRRYEAARARVMTCLAAALAVLTGCLALRVAPHPGDVLAGLVPTVPGGADGVLVTLGLLGGAALPRSYGRVTALVTGVLTLALLFLAAGLPHPGPLLAPHLAPHPSPDPAAALTAEYGTATARLFLAGFLATAFTALTGVWNGAARLVADAAEHYRLARVTGTEVPPGERESGRPHLAYQLWLTFPPMLLLLLLPDQPVRLVLAAGALSLPAVLLLAVARRPA